jgi:arylsulfatase A-like enzyme
MISLADLLATTAAVVGEKLPAAAIGAEDSHNAFHAFLGQSSKPARESLIVHSSDGVFAIRKGPWKWIEGIPAEGIKAGVAKTRSEEFKAQLYNTKDDPSETRDVSSEHPEIAKELAALLKQQREAGHSRG